MRPITTGGEARAPLPPCAAPSAFVPGMGRRMAAAALRPRPCAAPAPRTGPGLATACRVVAFCGVAAVGAALLYWQKSGGDAESREIARALQGARQARAQVAALRTEWTALNEPARLEELADRTLGLRPIAPAQFVEPGQLHAWLQAPVPPALPDPAPDATPEPGLQDVPSVPPPLLPRPPRPAPRPRLVALAPPPPRPPPVAAPPALRLAAAPPRPELPRWLTQPRRPAVLVMSEPPHDLAVPPAPRPAAPPQDPWPPQRSFAVAASPPPDGWEPAAPWPAAPSPYGWRPPY